jgi:mRNA interferase MazF
MPTSEPTRYTAGDVVVVPFPYSDRFAEKRRPALVVSNDELRAAGFLWIVMITTAQNSGMPHDMTIEDLPAAGLSKPSIIRPIKIANVEPSRILRRAGRLRADQAEAALEVVSSFLGRRRAPTSKASS